MEDKNVTGRRWRRRKLLLVRLKETIGYWKSKEKALDCTLKRLWTDYMLMIWLCWRTVERGNDSVRA